MSPRKGATRKNLNMFLMADGEAALFGFPKEKTVELEGTLMGTSAGRRTVVDSAALACYGHSASQTLMTSVATARLNHSAPLTPNALSPPRRSAMHSQTLWCYKPSPSSLWHCAVSSHP